MSLKKTQHEAFNQFFDKPTRERLKDLIKYNIGETDYLDFKKEWPDIVKLSKHILGLANSGGGCLIIGLEETSDGVIKKTGLSAFKDKVEIKKTIEKYIPDTLHYDILDFDFSDSDRELLKDKKFQVLLVEYKQEKLPFLSLKDGNGIKRTVAYIREGTETKEADHIEFQKLIKKRIKVEYSSIPLEKHLEQLHAMYKYIWPEDNYREHLRYKSALLDMQLDKEFEELENPDRFAMEEKERRMEDPSYGYTRDLSGRDFYIFVDEIISLKKAKIKKIVDV